MSSNVALVSCTFMCRHVLYAILQEIVWKAVNKTDEYNPEIVSPA